MAQQVIVLNPSSVADTQFEDKTWYGWTSLSESINRDLRRSNAGRSLQSFRINGDGEIYLTFNNRLSNTFEDSGAVDILVNERTYSFGLCGDNTVPYVWSPFNIQEARECYDALSGDEVTRTVLILRDGDRVITTLTFPLPDTAYSMGMGVRQWITGRNQAATRTDLAVPTGNESKQPGVSLSIDGDSGLGDMFHQFGGMDVTVSGNTYSFDLKGADTSEPYAWQPDNSTDADELYTALASRVEGTVRLRDAPLALFLPVANAGNATISINNIPAGDENTTVVLGANFNPGTALYDRITYEWKASSGSLTGATGANPTWTRPNVAAETTPTFDCKVILEGTGVKARRGSFVTIDAAQVTSTVRNVLGAANTRGTTVVITPVPAGDGGTDQQLDVTITKGTADYDTVEYLWTVTSGPLDDRTIKSPTWTRPSVLFRASFRITLKATFKGTGVTALDGTSASITRTLTAIVTPLAVVVTEIDLGDANFFDFGNSKTISYAVRPELVGKFVPSGQRRFLVNIGISATRLTINMANASTGSDVRADLTDEFEKNGIVRFHISGTDYIIPMNRRDNSEPYRLNGPTRVLTPLLAAFEGTGTMFFEFEGFNLVYNGFEYTKVNFGGNEYTKMIFNGQEY